MSSILATLIAQEKFEMRKFLATQRREENARRRGREGDLEQERPNIIERGVDKVLQPVRNIFSRIIGFFTKLFLGRILIKFLNFFSNLATGNNGKLLLGTWQGLYLFEHRIEPQYRKVIFHFLGN